MRVGRVHDARAHCECFAVAFWCRGSKSNEVDPLGGSKHVSVHV